MKNIFHYYYIKRKKTCINWYYYKQFKKYIWVKYIVYFYKNSLKITNKVKKSSWKDFQQFI